MSEHMKCIDPTTRWTWAPPAAPDTVFEYEAATGPVLMKLAEFYLTRVTRVTNIDIPGVGDFDEWVRPDPLHPTAQDHPSVEWSKVLPVNLSNALVDKIVEVSNLNKRDRRDSRSPSGQQPSQTSTTAETQDASAPDGSVHGGKTPPKQDGSGSAPKRKAGSR